MKTEVKDDLEMVSNAILMAKNLKRLQRRGHWPLTALSLNNPVKDITIPFTVLVYKEENKSFESGETVSDHIDKTVRKVMTCFDCVSDRMESGKWKLRGFNFYGSYPKPIFTEHTYLQK